MRFTATLCMSENARQNEIFEQSFFSRRTMASGSLRGTMRRVK